MKTQPGRIQSRTSDSGCLQGSREGTKTKKENGVGEGE